MADAMIEALQPISARPGNQPAPLGIPRRHARAVQRFIRAVLSGQEGDQRQTKGHECVVMVAHLPIALLPRGQRRKGWPQVAVRRAVEAACAPEALPWPEDCQRQHLTAAESGLVPRPLLGR